MAKIILRIIGGQNFLTKKQKPIVLMKTIKKEPGVVTVEKERFYYLGEEHIKTHERSAGKAAAGAIVGGVLTGGVGAIAGAAIGGRKKDTSTAMLRFAKYDTKEEFTVQVETDKNVRRELSNIKVAEI